MFELQKMQGYVSKEDRLHRLEVIIIEQQLEKWGTGLPCEEAEKEKARIRTLVREKYELFEPVVVALSQIEKMLRHKYGEEVSKKVFKIPLDSVKKEELVNLGIKLKDMLDKQMSQNEVLEELQPFINRSEKHRSERVKELKRQVEEEARKKEAAERKIQQALKEREELQQRLQELSEAGKAGPTPEEKKKPKGRL